MRARRCSRRIGLAPGQKVVECRLVGAATRPARQQRRAAFAPGQVQPNQRGCARQSDVGEPSIDAFNDPSRPGRGLRDKPPCIGRVALLRVAFVQPMKGIQIDRRCWQPCGQATGKRTLARTAIAEDDDTLAV